MDEQDLELITKLLDRDVELGEVLNFGIIISAVSSFRNSCQKLRDQATELDKKTRAIVGALNKMHSTPTQSSASRYFSIRAAFSPISTSESQYQLSLMRFGRC